MLDETGLVGVNILDNYRISGAVKNYLYRLMTEDKRELLIKNTAVDMMPVTYNIKYRHTAHCYLADKEYGTRLAEAMNLDMAWVEHLASLSEEERLKITAS